MAKTAGHRRSRSSPMALAASCSSSAGSAVPVRRLPRVNTSAPLDFVSDIASAIDLRGPQGDPASNLVTSVFGRTGAVAAQTGDYSAAQISGLGALATKSSVGTGDIGDDAVTDAKLRNSAGLSVIGRASNSTGDPADIIAASDGQVLRRSGTSVAFGTVATAGIADDAVDNIKLANMAQATVKGRAAAAGTGDPADLTQAQLTALINAFTSALSGAVPASGGGTSEFSARGRQLGTALTRWWLGLRPEGDNGGLGRHAVVAIRSGSG